jgi:hypothetical protein
MPIYIVGGDIMKISPVENNLIVSKINKPMKSRRLKNNGEERKDNYQRGYNSKKVTYEKPKFYYDKATIEKLKSESEKIYASLRKIVEKMIARQGYTVEMVKNENKEVKADATARKEAASLIAPDGPLGAEAVSDRIVEFAIALSGGDKGKLNELKEAIDKGFEEAGKILGGLPEISLQTYDLVMEKLDKWEKNEGHN